jgi:hypothetical protein
MRRSAASGWGTGWGAVTGWGKGSGNSAGGGVATGAWTLVLRFPAVPQEARTMTTATRTNSLDLDSKSPLPPAAFSFRDAFFLVWAQTSRFYFDATARVNLKRLETAISLFIRELEVVGPSMIALEILAQRRPDCPETDSGLGGRTLPPPSEVPDPPEPGRLPTAPEGPTTSCNTAR